MQDWTLMTTCHSLYYHPSPDMYTFTAPCREFRAHDSFTILPSFTWHVHIHNTMQGIPCTYYDPSPDVYTFTTSCREFRAHDSFTILPRLRLTYTHSQHIHDARYSIRNSFTKLQWIHTPFKQFHNYGLLQVNLAQKDVINSSSAFPLWHAKYMELAEVLSFQNSGNRNLTDN